MGNASGRVNGGRGDVGGGLNEATNAGISSNGGGASAAGSRGAHALTVRVGSADWMGNSPPQSPRHHLRSSPLAFNPQVPVVPLPGGGPPYFNQMQRNEHPGTMNQPFVHGIPTLITWSYGGNDVAVEGSWDNWQSRKILQRSGKDHTILLVLPAGLYHYKFIVDGNVRYIQDLPCEADHMGHVCNLLDVQDFIPENCDGAKEFETPESPESSYGNTYPREEDFAKEPAVVPPQLQRSVLDTENTDEAAAASSEKPQHVVLDHLFVEKGWASQSVLALGLTHRFQEKYVTLVLYKPLKK